MNVFNGDTPEFEEVKDLYDKLDLDQYAQEGTCTKAPKGARYDKKRNNCQIVLGFQSQNSLPDNDHPTSIPQLKEESYEHKDLFCHLSELMKAVMAKCGLKKFELDEERQKAFAQRIHPKNIFEVAFIIFVNDTREPLKYHVDSQNCKQKYYDQQMNASKIFDIDGGYRRVVVGGTFRNSAHCYMARHEKTKFFSDITSKALTQIELWRRQPGPELFDEFKNNGKTGGYFLRGQAPQWKHEMVHAYGERLKFMKPCAYRNVGACFKAQCKKLLVDKFNLGQYSGREVMLASGFFPKPETFFFIIEKLMESNPGCGFAMAFILVANQLPQGTASGLAPPIESPFSRSYDKAYLLYQSLQNYDSGIEYANDPGNKSKGSKTLFQDILHVYVGKKKVVVKDSTKSDKENKKGNSQKSKMKLVDRDPNDGALGIHGFGERDAQNLIQASVAAGDIVRPDVGNMALLCPTRATRKSSKESKDPFKDRFGVRAGKGDINNMILATARDLGTTCDIVETVGCKALRNEKLGDNYCVPMLQDQIVQKYMPKEGQENILYPECERFSLGDGDRVWQPFTVDSIAVESEFHPSQVPWMHMTNEQLAKEECLQGKIYVGPQYKVSSEQLRFLLHPPKDMTYREYFEHYNNIMVPIEEKLKEGNIGHGVGHHVDPSASPWNGRMRDRKEIIRYTEDESSVVEEESAHPSFEESTHPSYCEPETNRGGIGILPSNLLGVQEESTQDNGNIPLDSHPGYCEHKTIKKDISNLPSNLQGVQEKSIQENGIVLDTAEDSNLPSKRKVLEVVEVGGGMGSKRQVVGDSKLLGNGWQRFSPHTRVTETLNTTQPPTDPRRHYQQKAPAVVDPTCPTLDTTRVVPLTAPVHVGPNQRDIMDVDHVEVNLLEIVRMVLGNPSWTPDCAVSTLEKQGNVEDDLHGNHPRRMVCYYATLAVAPTGTTLDISNKAHGQRADQPHLVPGHRGVADARAGILSNHLLGTERVAYLSRDPAKDSLLWFVAYSRTQAHDNTLPAPSPPINTWLENHFAEKNDVFVTDTSGICRSTKKVLFAKMGDRYFFCPHFQDSKLWSVI
jgi:hypothetical protein